MAGWDQTFLAQVDHVSGQRLSSCYHCHTCAAGCPVSSEMQYGPDRVLRLIELGQRERVLCSLDIWLCASCETCAARCPNSIEVAKVMDTLRMLSIRDGFAPSLPRVRLFHQLYLKVIEKLGRSHEAVMLALYKLRSLDLFSDLDAGLALFLRRKLPLLPRRIGGISEVENIFKAAAEADRKLMGSTDDGSVGG